MAEFGRLMAAASFWARGNAGSRPLHVDRAGDQFDLAHPAAMLSGMSGEPALDLEPFVA